MMKKLSWLMVGALVALGGCGDDGVDDATDLTGEDMGTPIEDLGPVDALSCQAQVPTDGFGAIAGRNLRGFTLQDCSGTDYSFYNEEFCEAELTVISIAAGWCPPCITESEELEAEINEVYAGQGVRVIQILTQTADYSAPDLAYCQGWVDRFGLSNVELIDPAQLTGIYFPDNALPSTIIVDREGVIRFRENGATDGLTSLKSGINAVLAD
jgi:cytochrome c biogenesis protein CcmG, thiol:disulfide interchange protein DsbE